MDRTDRVMASFIQELMRRAVQDALNAPEPPPHPDAARAESPVPTAHAAG